jgi:hypothetical protein
MTGITLGGRRFRDLDRTQRRRVTRQLSLLAAAAALVYAQQHLLRQPYHTSVLSGRAWVQELLDGHERRMREVLGLHKHVFLKLLSELYSKGGLRDSKYVDAEEMLAIFLYAAVHNSTNRELAERFQRSGETISK